MEAVRDWKKRSTTPTRAAAARELAEDPDPRTSRALAEAASDKSWIVRAAALEAIAKRGDPALLETAAQQMSDKKDIVRSEEHTSELQSPDHLVCRLLLEKKKKRRKRRNKIDARRT